METSNDYNLFDCPTLYYTTLQDKPSSPPGQIVRGLAIPIYRPPEYNSLKRSRTVYCLKTLFDSNFSATSAAAPAFSLNSSSFPPKTSLTSTNSSNNIFSEESYPKKKQVFPSQSHLKLGEWQSNVLSRAIPPPDQTVSPVRVDSFQSLTLPDFLLDPSKPLGGGITTQTTPEPIAVSSKQISSAFSSQESLVSALKDRMKIDFSGTFRIGNSLTSQIADTLCSNSPRLTAENLKALQGLSQEPYESIMEDEEENELVVTPSTHFDLFPVNQINVNNTLARRSGLKRANSGHLFGDSDYDNQFEFRKKSRDDMERYNNIAGPEDHPHISSISLSTHAMSSPLSIPTSTGYSPDSPSPASLL